MDKFMEELIAELKNVLDESYNPVPVKAKKNNRLVYTGIRFDKTGECISPTIYVDDMYEAYTKGWYTMVDVILHIQKMLKEKADVGDIVNEIQQYDGAKPMLRVALINYDANQEVLKERVHKQFLDLAIVPFIDVTTENGMDGMIYVTENIVQKWGVDNETILEQSMQNMLDKEQFFVANLEEIANRHYCVSNIDDIQIPEVLFGALVISNEKKQYGAKIMLNPDLLHKIAVKFDSNLIIYPSSTHELFAIVEERYTRRMLTTEDVQGINEHEVRREDQLSNSVYYYDRERKEVTIREAGAPLFNNMEAETMAC